MGERERDGGGGTKMAKEGKRMTNLLDKISSFAKVTHRLHLQR